MSKNLTRSRFLVNWYKTWSKTFIIYCEGFSGCWGNLWSSTLLGDKNHFAIDCLCQEKEILLLGTSEYYLQYSWESMLNLLKKYLNRSSTIFRLLPCLSTMSSHILTYLNLFTSQKRKKKDFFLKRISKAKTIDFPQPRSRVTDKKSFNALSVLL